MDLADRIAELKKSRNAEDRITAIFMDPSIVGIGLKEHKARWRAKDVLTRFLEQQRVVDFGHRFAGKLDVGYRTDALDDGSLGHDVFLDA